MRISLYRNEHQGQLVELAKFYGADNVTRMMEQLIEAAYADIQVSQLGGSNDKEHQQREAA